MKKGDFIFVYGTLRIGQRGDVFVIEDESIAMRKPRQTEQGRAVWVYKYQPDKSNRAGVNFVSRTECGVGKYFVNCQVCQRGIKMTKKELVVALKKKGVRIAVMACGCCSSPYVKVESDGKVVIESDEYNFDMFEQDVLKEKE